MSYCEVVSCEVNRDEDGHMKKGVSKHLVPASDTLTRKRWMCFLEEANKDSVWRPIKKMRVCSNHFREEDVNVGPSGRKVLRSEAFPCIIPNRNLTDYILSKHPDHNPKPVAVVRILTADELMKTISHLNHENLQLKLKLRRTSAESSEKDKTIQKLTDQRDKKNHQIKILLQSLRRRSKQKHESVPTIVDATLVSVELRTPLSYGENMFVELQKRKSLPRNAVYSNVLREFSFNADYMSPKCYRYIRRALDYTLPAPSNFAKWTRSMDVDPGLIQLSLAHIKKSCLQKKTYYGVAFDEMAIRQGLRFRNGKMCGVVDYGKLSDKEHEPDGKLAKSALFCVATEINGSKSFPVAYILTCGLTKDTMCDFVKVCINAIDKCGGTVISVSTDGHRSNISAMKQLGACLDPEDPSFDPFVKVFEDKDDTIPYLPDNSHMSKLARNTLARLKLIYNGDLQKIEWRFVENLAKVQETEQLRAGNKLTRTHVNFQTKKMNTRLCVQVFSQSTASSLHFCRKIGEPGFEGCEATAEFLAMNDEVFDLLNSRPFGTGRKAPLRIEDKMRWLPIIQTAKTYYKNLQIIVDGEPMPLYQTTSGTFVTGYLACLTGLETLMERIESGQILLSRLPTFRCSQDPTECFFGTVRRRLGNNDNPDILQLKYSVRAILLFHIDPCLNGNCMPQEYLQEPIETRGTDETSEPEESGDGSSLASNETDDLPNVPLSSLSLYVENVVTYIAGFVGKKLGERLGCDECISTLGSRTGDIEATMHREDYVLLLEKDLGGLWKPSDELIRLCRLTERVIRQQQACGVTGLKADKIQNLVRRECVGRTIFEFVHAAVGNIKPNRTSFVTSMSHRWSLISEIIKIYTNVRLHFICKTYNYAGKPESRRQQFKHLNHFRGE